MKKCLIVVDMQNDFIDGTLGTAEAVKIVPNVVEKVKSFDGEIIFTRDTHHENYLNTQEGKNLPVKHCIKDTAGWEICSQLNNYAKKVFDKPSFGSVELAKYLLDSGCEEINLVGLCTDICVISNAVIIKAFLPEVKITVDASCCAGVTPQSHNNALEAMKVMQIEVINS